MRDYVELSMRMLRAQVRLGDAGKPWEWLHEAWVRWLNRELERGA